MEPSSLVGKVLDVLELEEEFVGPAEKPPGVVAHDRADDLPLNRIQAVS